MQTESEMDVFISYSSLDKDWVHGELLERIEEAGLKVFIDTRDFERGAPSIKEMERGVIECRKTLLVLTPHYVQSGWCDIENIMAQTRDPANEQLRLIPLLKAECKKPLRIATLTHIDFTDDADHDLAWRQLLTALGRPPEPVPPEEPRHDDWFLAHPYPMPPNFTGRGAEIETLNGWLGGDAAHPLLCLRALGGFGKSALAWHWLTHDVRPAAWPRVVWWSFYEGDASFDSFLTETLDYLSGGQVNPQNPSANDVADLLRRLHDPGTLLVLDGFERALRAFGGLNAAYQGDAPGGDEDRDCISPLAERFLRDLAALPHLRAKVLLTTRLRPRALEAKGGDLLQGCREEELEQMQPADAVDFFRAQGIRGTHTEIEQVCEPYGYHPLSLRLLAGLTMADLRQPGDVAAAKRLDVGGELVQRQHHVLEVAYDSLTPERRELLSRIACFRGPVKYEALKALAEAGEEERADTEQEDDLQDLIARGLLHHDAKEGRFDLHPIVRRYAYDQLTAPDRAAAHTGLRDYFAAVPPSDKVTRLEDLAPVIELYHHTVRTGRFDEAWDIFYQRLDDPTYDQLGAWQSRIDLLCVLFPDGEDHSPRLTSESAQAWTANMLACCYSLSGQPRRAVLLFERQNAISESQGDKKNLAIGLGSVASDQRHIGTLRAAEANMRRSIALCREIEGEVWEAMEHQGLGWLLAHRGAYAESETELATGLEMSTKKNGVHSQCVVWAYRALRELLMLRAAPQSALGTPHAALESARRALELADETARSDHPYERDYVQAHWLLGATHHVAGQPDEAERHLHEALERCRRINLVEFEANIRSQHPC